MQGQGEDGGLTQERDERRGSEGGGQGGMEGGEDGGQTQARDERRGSEGGGQGGGVINGTHFARIRALRRG